MGLWDFLSHMLCNDSSYSPEESSSDYSSDSEKYEESKETEETQRILEIRKQMEYYLSAPNLHSNKKLFQLINHSKNRFVSIEVFLQYNKMRSMEASKDEIITACKGSRILELNADNTKVRTLAPIEVDKNYRDRVVRFEGFSHHETFNSLEEKLKRQFPNIVRISMNHQRVNYTSEVFSGVVYVEFDTVESAENAKSGFEYRGKHITGELIQEYQKRITLPKKKIFRHHSI